MDPTGADNEQRCGVLAGETCWTGDGIYINSSDSMHGIDINGLNKEQVLRKLPTGSKKKELVRQR